jgi:hypothetical protein
MGLDNTSYLRTIKFLTADYTIIQADSGATFMLAATGKAITLPAAASLEVGTNFKFVVGATIATTPWIIISADNDIHGQIQGGGIDDEGAGTGAGTPEDTITIIHSGAEEGDWCEIVGDGVFWYLSGQCELQANITVTT